MNQGRKIGQAMQKHKFLTGAGIAAVGSIVVGNKMHDKRQQSIGRLPYHSSGGFGSVLGKSSGGASNPAVY